MSLPLPEQELVETGEGDWELEFRRLTPVEDWNAQISLLTGMAAASLMVYARVGILRTLPPADPRDVQRLHRTARALGIEWPAEQLYPDFIRSLDPSGRPTRRWSSPARGCCAAPATSPSTASCRSGPALGPRLGVRPRHRAAAPPRRPLRRRGLRRAVRRHRGARLGGRRDGRAARHDERVRSARQPVRERDREPLRGRAAAERVGESSPPSSSRSTRRTPQGDDHHRGARHRGVGHRAAALPLGEEVTVELVQADPASRSVGFTLA